MNVTNDTLTILKFFEKYKGGWFNATAVSHELDMSKARVKGVLTILVDKGFIEEDDEHFYRFKENRQKMIKAEEIREYQKERKMKIDITPYINAIEEVIKENMIDLWCTGITYAFNEFVFVESLEKIIKILKDNGYDASPILSSHHYKFGGINIKWGE